MKISFNTNCLAVAYLVSEFKPTPSSRKFDKVETRLQIERKMFSVRIPTSQLV